MSAPDVSPIITHAKGKKSRERKRTVAAIKETYGKTFALYSQEAQIN